jgi:hypothetical protein
MSAGFWWAIAVGAFANLIAICAGAHYMGNQLVLPVALLGIVVHVLAMLGAAAIYEHTNPPVVQGRPR